VNQTKDGQMTKADLQNSRMSSVRADVSHRSRRNFLRFSSGVLAAATVTDLLLTPNKASGQNPTTPDSAVQQLLDGNGRYVAGKMTSFDHDLEILRNHNAEKQEPFAAVLSCADSRVPVELLFDQTVGHLFVVRVAGNLATHEIVASLEYGAAVLGTKAILVLGHSGCGAVKAAVEGKPVPGQISTLFTPMRTAIDQGGHDLAAVTKANAAYQARVLRESSTVIAPMVKENKIKVVAGVYDIATGKVALV
jgi:carbonic anhydrase